MPVSPSLAKGNSSKASKCFVERADLLNTLIDSNDIQSGSVASLDAKSVASSHSRSGDNASKCSKGSPDHGSSPVKVGSSLSLTSSSNSADVQAKMLLDRTRLSKQADKDKKFSQLQGSLKESLDFLDTVDRELSLVNETKRTKTRRQFEEWNKTVHGKIQETVLKSVNAISAKELHNRKLESYDKFLAITNRKPAIFRDIIIESEYDPLEINRTAIHAKTGALKDPLDIDRQKAASELAMVGLTLKESYNVSDRLAVPLWAKGKIESTPYGMFASMMTPEDEKEGSGEGIGFARPESKQRLEREKKQRGSNVVFDDFNYPIGKAAVDVEMPKGKPRTRKIYTDPKALVTDPKTGGPYPMEFQKELMRIGQTGKV